MQPAASLAKPNAVSNRSVRQYIMQQRMQPFILLMTHIKKSFAFKQVCNLVSVPHHFLQPNQGWVSKE
jgi:hypothetical protein